MEYVRCVCVYLGSSVARWRGWEGDECMRGLGLGFINRVGTGGVLDMCLCLGCGGVRGEWVWGLDHGLEGWDGVMSV